MPLSICKRNKRNKLKTEVQLRKQIFLSTQHVAQNTFRKSSLAVLLNDCLIFGKFRPSVAYKKYCL